MSDYRAKVTGLGAYLPTGILSNDELALQIDIPGEWIYTRTGIRPRHIADHEETTSDLAANAAEKAEIPMEKFYLNLDRRGNTGSASIPIAMSDARAEGRMQPGDLILLAGFGAGFTWGGATIRC